MNEEIRGKLSKIYCAVEVITLCILIFTIIYLNFFKLVNSINTDYIAEFNYGRNVWETKNIVSDSWICANEYMFFRPALLYALVYGITGKYLLSGSIVLSIAMVAVIASFYYLCKGIEAKRINIWGGIIVLLSMCGNGRSFIVLTSLFYGYYAFYLAASLFTIGVLERIRRSTPKHLASRYVSFIFAVLLGMVGIRMTVLLYLPILIISVVVAKKVKSVGNIECRKIGCSLFIFNIIGICIGKLFLPREVIFSDVLQISIINFEDLFSRLWNNMVAALQMVAGTRGGMKAMSINTVDCASKVLLIVLLIYAAHKNRKRFINIGIVPINTFVDLFFLCNLVAILAVTTLTNFGEGVSFYYFLFPCFLSYMLVSLMEVSEKGKNVFLLKILIFCMCITNFFTYYFPYIQSQRNGEVDNLVTFLEDKSIDRITMSFWQAGPVQAYSDGEIQVAFIYPGADGDDLYPYIYLNTKENYENNTIVVLTDEEESRVLANAESKLNMRKNIKIGEVNSYNIYEFESELFPRWIPDQGCTISNRPETMILVNGGYLDDNRNAVSSGGEGFFVIGPYVSVEDGVYDITFTYSILDNAGKEQAGYVDVSADSGAHVQSCEELSEAMEAITLRNVDLAGLDNVEFRVFAYQGAIISVEGVSISRVG